MLMKSTVLYMSAQILSHPGHGSLRSLQRKRLDFFKFREDIFIKRLFQF